MYFRWLSMLIERAKKTSCLSKDSYGDFSTGHVVYSSETETCLHKLKDEHIRIPHVLTSRTGNEMEIRTRGL